MKTLIFIWSLLVPSIAFAGSTFDISCDNVSKIYIDNARMRLNQTSSHDQFYIVRFVLKPDAKDEFGKRVKASRSIIINRNGVDYDRDELTITTNGIRLRNDEPDVDANEDDEAAVTIREEQDAFAVARSVCPALAPTKVITYGP